jgi:hypothetical protein
MKFIFDDPDMEFVKADVPGTDISLEVTKIEEDSYAIYYHSGENVYDCAVFSKKELKVLWKMLSSK